MTKKWSRKFDKCIVCSRNNILHYARGHCSACWDRLNRKYRIRKYNRDPLHEKIRSASKIHNVSIPKITSLFEQKICFYCETPIEAISGRTFQIDHKIVGIMDESNLVASCFTCNRRKSDNTTDSLILFLEKITCKKVTLS